MIQRWCVAVAFVPFWSGLGNIIHDTVSEKRDY